MMVQQDILFDLATFSMIWENWHMQWGGGGIAPWVNGPALVKGYCIKRAPIIIIIILKHELWILLTESYCMVFVEGW